MEDKAKMSGEMRQLHGLSPQARLTVHMLRLPMLELREFLEQETWENPLLEDERTEEYDETAGGVEALEGAERDYPSLRHSGSYRGLDEDKKRYIESLITKEETLEDHLLWQLGVFLEGEEYRVGEYIIESLDDDGYLRGGLEEVSAKFGIARPRAEEILALIRSFDPPGVASRDLKECLLAQLAAGGKEDTPAYSIVEACMAELEKKEYKKISKKLKLSSEETEKALKQVEALEPKPGRAYTTERTVRVNPDIVVREEAGAFAVELNNAYLPSLRMSGKYLKMMRDKNTDAATKGYLKKKKERADWVIKAILQRQETIKRVAEFVVDYQKEFMDDPARGIKPLRLADAASKLSISESTVSRVVAHKFIQTPYGTFPLKRFFSTELRAEGEESVSADTVKEKIRRAVRGEDKRKPLSDRKITDLLKKEGITVSRRVVAKYREAMRILPARMRKK